MGFFVDFDKKDKVFYCNLYVDDYKLVVKTPIVKKEKKDVDVKIERFDLTKYTYLFAHE